MNFGTGLGEHRGWGGWESWDPGGRFVLAEEAWCSRPVYGELRGAGQRIGKKCRD